MNQNDMDRYFWRTGQQWSGDGRPTPKSFRGSKTRGPAIIFLFLSFVATLVALFLQR
jgi:hypothetical protein